MVNITWVFDDQNKYAVLLTNCKVYLLEVHKVKSEETKIWFEMFFLVLLVLLITIEKVSPFLLY